MQMVRTTLRVRSDLKRAAELLAVHRSLTLQDVFNQALELQLRHLAKNQAKKIVFSDHDLGVPLDNLRRQDYYDES